MGNGMSYKFDFQWKSVWLSTIEIVIVESKDLVKYDDNIDKVLVLCVVVYQVDF